MRAVLKDGRMGASLMWEGGSNRKGPLAPGSALGPGGLQEVGITRPEGSGGSMMVEEVREVGGS